MKVTVIDGILTYILEKEDAINSEPTTWTD